MFKIDHQRMRQMAEMPPRPATAAGLFREGRAFFVGGTLPIQETLETMFESQSEASTDIFVVTFGGEEVLRQGLEMVRSLKRNFNMRLMARLEGPVAEAFYPQLYAAGADLLEIGAPAATEGVASDGRWTPALAAFPRWSVASAVTVDGTHGHQQMNLVDDLLREGVVPLPRLGGDGAEEKETSTALHHFVKSWRLHHVPVKPFAAVIERETPLVPTQKPGALRTLFDRLHERRQLVASDLLRHLRVSEPTDSLDSAGL